MQCIDEVCILHGLYLWIVAAVQLGALPCNIQFQTVALPTEEDGDLLPASRRGVGVKSGVAIERQQTVGLIEDGALLDLVGALQGILLDRTFALPRGQCESMFVCRGGGESGAGATAVPCAAANDASFRTPTSLDLQKALALERHAWRPGRSRQ